MPQFYYVISARSFAAPLQIKIMTNNHFSSNKNACKYPFLFFFFFFLFASKDSVERGDGVRPSTYRFCGWEVPRDIFNANDSPPKQPENAVRLFSQFHKKHPDLTYLEVCIVLKRIGELTT